ncbi:aldo/keto reductase [Rhizobium leguminosarum]|uniref:aldo/keto reductase n=1 Tax=Rhizobium leguminosarum TaxID=384 RepID=UPI001C9873D7|nr:aldo/keto reductase [Rhizobium leguminosarum]MBY5370566.1 aldo/keto reductase [Rhizobium leguminosarum]
MTDLAIGLWGLSGPNTANGIQLGWDEVNRPVDVLKRAFELGAAALDTSDFYGAGRGELLVNEALSVSEFANIPIFTKGGLRQSGEAKNGTIPRSFDPDYICSAFSASYRRLGERTVDTYFLHGPTIDAFTDGRLLRTLEKLRDEGRVRRFGLSLRRSGLKNPAYLQAVSNDTFFDVIQLPISPLYADVVTQLRGGLFSDKILFARSINGHGLLLKDAVDENDFSSSDHRRGLLDEAFTEQVRKTAVVIDRFSRAIGVSRIRFLRSYALAVNVEAIILGARNVSQVEEGFTMNLAPLDDDILRAFHNELK